MGRRSTPPTSDTVKHFTLFGLNMKTRSYSLALYGLNVGAWRRHPNAVVRSQNLWQFVLSYVWICAVYKNIHICISFKSLFTLGITGMPNVTTNNSL